MINPLITKKILIFFLTALLLFTPLLAQQNMNEYLEGKLAGEMDAESKDIWFLAGFLGMIGVLLAYVVEPEVPSQKLIGKPPYYIQGYMEGYKKKSRNKNVTKALYGMVASTVAYCTCYFILIAGMLSTADTAQ